MERGRTIAGFMSSYIRSVPLVQRKEIGCEGEQICLCAIEHKKTPQDGM
jgi:hypothetical protein